MSTILEDQFGTLVHDETTNLIRLDWFPATEELTLEDYKRTLTALADAVSEHQAAGMLVNVRDFRSGVPGEDGGWREEVIVPKYNTVLKRFAWLAGEKPAELPGGGAPYCNEGEDYENRWFRDEAEAVAWANQG